MNSFDDSNFGKRLLFVCVFDIQQLVAADLANVISKK